MSNNLGQNIQKYRKLKGMTQEKLAEFSNLSTTFLSKLECSENQNISVQKLEKIAQTLNVKVTDLLSDNVTNKLKQAEHPNLDILIKQLSKLEHSKSERLAKYFSLLIDEIK